MVQTIENNAIINSVKDLANLFKEKVALTWYKSTVDYIKSKPKAAFRKAAEARIAAFEKIGVIDNEVKEAESSGDETRIKDATTAFAEAIKVFGEGGKLSEIQTSAYGLVTSTAKTDPTCQTSIGQIGMGLEIGDEDNIRIFKTALVQSVIWAGSQIKNEAAQAAAKAAAEKKAKEDAWTAFKPLFEGLAGWQDDEDDPSDDETVLLSTKTLIGGAWKVLSKELKVIESEGSGSTALSVALAEEVEDICSELEQRLSPKTLSMRDKDGTKIWTPRKNLFTGTTARKILEAAQVRLSALRSKVDRTLSRLSAMKGAAKITW